MSINLWINKYNKTKKPYEFALVNRNGKLVSIDALRIGNSIGENAYKLLSGKPISFNVNGEEYSVSTWKNMLFDYMNAVIGINPINYEKMLSLSGRLSCVVFQDEGKEVQDYQINKMLTLNNGKIIYIHANRDAIIMAIAQITSWVNDNSPENNKINARFNF